LTVIRSGARHKAALIRVLLSLPGAVILTACNTNTNREVTPTVGVDSGVALVTAGDLTSLYEGSTLALAATVTNPSNDAGVSWTMTGAGSLSGVTNSSATYVAPTAVTGATDALITATSITNPAQIASVTIVTEGAPVNNTATPFPANVDTGYLGVVSIAGGESPITWTLTSGTLPPGMSLNGSATGQDTYSGTPTTAGTYSFVVEASDALARTAFVPVTLTVNPPAACLLSGNYTFTASGFRGGGPYTHTGAIAIDAVTGNVTGIQDYKDTHRTTTGEVLTSGYCTNREDNAGSLKLIGPSGTLVYNFAATPPDSNGVIHSAPMALISSGSDGGSGEVTLQQQTAITASPPSGNFAFGLIGVDSSSLHFGTAGRFTTNSSGTMSAGLIDSNDAGKPLNDATLTGTLSAPDVYGRGTATLTTGSQTSTLAYYLINVNKMLLMDIDSAGGTPIASGQMTAQVGDVSPGVFSNNALGSPAVMSLFGASGNIEPMTVMEMGVLTNGNAAGGTVDATLDVSYQDVDDAGLVFSGQSYSVDPASGRGVLSLVNSANTLSFTFYLDGIADGYIVEQTGVAGSAGFLEAQFQGPYPIPPAQGTFPDTLPDNFAGYTAYPQSHGPIGLETALTLNYGALSSSETNGSFAIDPTTGRGLGSLTESGIGSTPAVLYVVSPTKVDIMRFGTRALDGSIDFLVQN
jgi:putative Ig domain-containing protein